jgi:carbon-monoxide dehydrogenase medium subunit
MKPFSYFEPATVGEAVGLLDRLGPEARILAGGQSLLLDLKSRAARPRHLVSLAHVRDLGRWRYTDDGALEIGATLTYAAAGAAAFQGWHREISRICLDLADRSVRSMATLGGAACQAEARFDIPPLLVGTGALLTIGAPGGSRIVPAARFFKPEGGTILAPGEILTAITFPPPEAFSSVAFEKFRHRVFDAAIASVFCGLGFDAADRVETARLVVGAVRDAPTDAPDAARSLHGLARAALPDPALPARLAEEVLPEAEAASRPRRYQRELVKTLVGLAVARAAVTGS